MDDPTPRPAPPAAAAPGDPADPARTQPSLRTIAMPADANPSGDIFGGWLLAQMDLAGAVPARRRAQGRVATVAVDAMRFLRPVHIGDEVSCYTRILATGTTSVTVQVDVEVARGITGAREKVTEARFTYVALTESGQKRPLPPLPAAPSVGVPDPS